MLLTSTSYCDFLILILTPIDYVFVRVERDNDILNEIIEKTSLFWRKFILQEIITRKLEKAKLLKPSNYYCTHCNSSNGEMVGCDSCDQWYHPNCINLKRLPAAKIWYCNLCRNKKSK